MLFSFRGRVSRGRYVALGALLFGLKYPLDHAVATLGFGQEWSPIAYLSVLRGPLLRAAAMPALWLSLLGVALPFLWAGLALTVRRLRDAGRSPAWSILFFAPYVNYIFFTVAAALPGRPEPSPLSDAGPESDEATGEDDAGLGRLIPRNLLGAAALALSLSASLTITALFLTRELGSDWGVSLFLMTPFSIGVISAVVLEYHEPVGLGLSFALATFLGLLSEIVLLVLGAEGMACLVMATPLVLIIIGLGAVVGHQLAGFRHRLATLALAVALVPVSMLAEGDLPRAPLRVVVESVVECEATPELVWNRVVAFPPIEESPAALFEIGIPVLERARIDGSRAGATRRCVFNTGEFVEPIEVWQPGRELTFGVTSQPRHLDGYLEVKRGQFVLERTASGGTSLIGRTWFDLRVHPAAYWRLWAEPVVHEIHLRALRHIRRLSEADAVRRRER